jgi:PAS domain S-box-containing protein
VYRSKPDERLTVEFITVWCQRITGYTPEEVIHNAKISAVDMIYPEDREKVLAYFQEALEAHRPGRIIYRIVTATGSVKWISNRFRGVYSDDKNVRAIEGFFNDITSQMQAEHDLTQALLEVQDLKNRLEEENVYLRQEIKHSHNFEEMIFQSDTFKQVLGQVQQVAVTEATVLILGETGTGKELIARAVHNLSSRKDRPLVKVNCAALSANLIESELFGHEKGAFTGAIAKKIGRFELAHVMKKLGIRRPT